MIWALSVVSYQPISDRKGGRDFKEVIKEITSIVDGPISGEVKATTTQAEDMVKEGRRSQPSIQIWL